MPERNSQPLTERTNQAAKPTGARVILWDSTLVGFGVRIQPSGLKSYILDYRFGHPPRQHRTTIARVGEVLLKVARDRAAEIKYSARHDNLDPTMMRLDLDAMRREFEERLDDLAAKVARLESNMPVSSD